MASAPPRKTAGSRRKRNLHRRNPPPTNSAPRRNRRNRNESGGSCANTALVAGNVAPQINIVSRSANRGMESRDKRGAPRDVSPGFGHRTNPLSPSLRRSSLLGFAQRTTALFIRPGLLHRR